MRLLLTAMVLALLAVPASAMAGENSVERASGAGSQSTPMGSDAFTTHIAFSATHDVLTNEVKGYFVAKGALDGMPFRQQGEVTCLKVVGNQASIKYRFDRASGGTATFEGGGIEVFVEDKGPKGDRATFGPPQPPGIFQTDESRCDDPNMTLTYQPLDSGNFVVRNDG